MKTKSFFLLTLLFFAAFSLQAQFNFVVQNGSASAYKSLSEAYEAANKFDTIYLPGGSFDIPVVEKSLVWIGVGYHPDSTEATFYTRINNAATFSGSCDSTYITGIHFASNLSFGSSGDDAFDVKLFRCRISGDCTLKYSDGQTRDTDMIISECIFDRNINGNYASNVTIEKSIIQTRVNYLASSTLDRIMVLAGSRNTSSGFSYCFHTVTDCFIMNSIINYYYYANWQSDAYSCVRNTYKNNIFAGSEVFPAGTNNGENNLVSVDLSTVFEHLEGSSISPFSYLHDFHLKAGSPAIGAGLNGSDIGIYGGSRPFKEGGLPVYPHIREVNVDTETTNGILHVEISAVAQDK